jgi:hypothetical protein
MPYEKESALFVQYCMVEQKCEINPSTFPGLKSGICSGLILSGALHPVLALYPILKDGVWRRRSINIAGKTDDQMLISNLFELLHR